MDKLRRSFRSSFRKKREESSLDDNKPKSWPMDQAAVKTNTCSFPVKYLGCVEVFESRGMQVCEEAVKLLKNSKRRPIRGVLHISSDGLRVVDEDTKGLVVDQTIEKVSFCAPDRNFEKGFSYICRDGTTRRWMCHGFMSVRDTGERLSHALGCAFAICLERKQKRDRECAVTMTYDDNANTFTRLGSFRQGSITERLQDPQNFRPAEPPKPPKEPTENPFAVSRPRPSNLMYERGASFRGTPLIGTSPFKRQFSLRLNELPSTLERLNSPGDGADDAEVVRNVENVMVRQERSETGNRRAQIYSVPAGFNPGITPEFSPIKEEPGDDVQRRVGDNDNIGRGGNEDVMRRFSSLSCTDPFSPVSSGPPSLPANLLQLSLTSTHLPTLQEDPPVHNINSAPPPLLVQPEKIVPTQLVRAAVATPPLSQVPTVNPEPTNPWDNVPDQPNVKQDKITAEHRHQQEESLTLIDEWLGGGRSGRITLGHGPGGYDRPGQRPLSFTSEGRTQSLDCHSYSTHSDDVWTNQERNAIDNKPTAEILDDPFDAEWAALAVRNNSKNTNPFHRTGTVKAFELQM